jgi:hypothetical protein
MSEGPTILWGQLKGKRVRSNDGNDLGKIDKISQNYIRLEKGRVNKNKFWLPKYYADTFDGKVLWLLEGEEQLRSTYLYGKEPPPEQFQQDYDTFRLSHSSKKDRNLDKIDVTNERKMGVASKPRKSVSGYKNIRELK